MKKINPAHLAAMMSLTNSCPYYRLLGMRIVELGSGYSRVEMDVDMSKHGNPFGSVHGGAYASLIDVAAYWAAYSDQAEDAGMTSLDLAVTNLSMCRGGKLTAHGKAVKEGRSICLSEVTITDDTGKLIAHGTSKLLMLNGRQSAADALRAAGRSEVPPKFLNSENE
ncbi:MAG: PaaI family thioesterase [Clostridiales bacterium]|nr:PaaI family thioesterase [Clostridiales bacterium]MBE5775472.1 PaaI family thioesterase [Clostridiales bacterium]